MAYQQRRAGANWWDATWNSLGGCSHASPGCKNCYAQQLAGTQQTAHRIAIHEGVTDWVRGKPVFNGQLTVAAPEHPVWLWPLKWQGARHPVLGDGQPSLIFVGDMADVFHEERPIPIIEEVVSTITASPHIGQLLTKRADVMTKYFTTARSSKTLLRWQSKLWLGFSAERQTEFDERWTHMRKLASSGWTVFAHIGPMLGPVTLPPDFLAYGERVWAICSGEQGRNARLMDAAWPRAVHDQCQRASVPFFMLQMAGRKPIPADLFIRQFPRRHVGRG